MGVLIESWVGVVHCSSGEHVAHGCSRQRARRDWAARWECLSRRVNKLGRGWKDSDSTPHDFVETALERVAYRIACRRHWNVRALLASPVLLAGREHYWVIKHHTVPLAVPSPCATFNVPLLWGDSFHHHSPIHSLSALSRRRRSHAEAASA
jgi:hypothetical protein